MLLAHVLVSNICIYILTRNLAGNYIVSRMVLKFFHQHVLWTICNKIIIKSQ